MLSPDQLAARKTGITATDISAILGKNPWRSPLDVFLDKTGARDTFEGNVRTKWGNLLEPVIRDDYAERHGARVEVPGTLVRPSHEWQIATPDGIVYPMGDVEPDRGLEIKVHGRDAIISGSLRYGDPGTDDVPMHELLQCMWGMTVTGLRRWDLVVFADGVPVEYVIDRDDELISMLTERAERFLVDNVQANAAPDPDGSDSYDAWLKARWAKNSEQLIAIDDDAEACAAVSELRKAMIAAKQAEARLEICQQQIKLRIGEHSGLTWREGRGKPPSITWRRNKDSEGVDLAAMVQHLKTTAGLVVSAYSPELAILERLLLKIGGGYIGDSTSSGVEILKVVRDLREKLAEIANAKEQQFVKTSMGARVLRLPKSWHDDARS